jgi:tetratricopeptide (TPR) repeat protein
VPNDDDLSKLFIDSLIEQLNKRTAELSQANVDRGKLQQQIDELQRKLAKPEKALDEALTPNADLGAQLDALRGRYDPNRIAAAKEAMAQFDYDAAEAVFQQMRDDTTDAVKLQAAAEYGLGEIAEARVDWPAAAQHYDRAADLNPTIDTLDKAGEFLWRNGQYDLAEAAYNQALEIARRTIGEDHPSFATHLNNLAGVYLKKTDFPRRCRCWSRLWVFLRTGCLRGIVISRRYRKNYKLAGRRWRWGSEINCRFVKNGCARPPYRRAHLRPPRAVAAV